MGEHCQPLLLLIQSDDSYVTIPSFVRCLRYVMGGYAGLPLRALNARARITVRPVLWKVILALLFHGDATEGEPKWY